MISRDPNVRVSQSIRYGMGEEVVRGGLEQIAQQIKVQFGDKNKNI